MSVFTGVSGLPHFNAAVVTIGTFDGVHLGHVAILNEVRKQALSINGESVLITFDPHPRSVLFPEQELKILTPLREKIQLIERAGIDHVVIIPFTKEFAGLTAEEYVRDFLVKSFQPSVIVIGHDHHFGQDRKGNIALLKSMEDSCGFSIKEIPVQLIDEATVSSTKIRKALEAGSVDVAAQMLGRNYSLTGTVVHGAELGRTIGFPTANIQPSDPAQLIPANGVYAVYVTVHESRYPAMMNIGVRPTVSSELKLHIEANIFGFAENIYDREVTVEFVSFLRNEKKFAGLDELKTQLKTDELHAKESLAVAKGQQ